MTRTSGTKPLPGQAAADRFAEMMIGRMERLKGSRWEKGWIGGPAGAAGLPENVSGRAYGGSNALFLQMHTAAEGFRAPVFMTFNQAAALGGPVRKGEKAFPVVFWETAYRDADGRKITRPEYEGLGEEEKSKARACPVLRYYSVFNLDQTLLEEARPELAKRLLDKFAAAGTEAARDTRGMYANAALDRMVERQEWVCPIQADRESASAFYSPSEDRVVVPEKGQFNKGTSPEERYEDGMEYYSTMLHEMAHSTMRPGRLDRPAGGRFGSPGYAKEELVAELTAAMAGHAMGFDRKVTDNSAKYLNAWIRTLREEPRFIVSVMSDVNKASAMVFAHVDRQRLALGEKPYLAADDPGVKEEEGKTASMDAAIYRTAAGDYAMRASREGAELGSRKIGKPLAAAYFRMTDMDEKRLFLDKAASEAFAPEAKTLKESTSASAGKGKETSRAAGRAPTRRNGMRI